MDSNSAAVAFAAVVCGGLFLMFLVTGPLGKAMGRWLESYGGSAVDPRRLQELEGRVTELEALSQRTAELEERLEFAERLLSKLREPERLPPVG
jgi:hypothetical protein